MALTIGSVAARAGVAKSTIYRHWPGRLALIADAFETLHELSAPAVDGLQTRDALIRLLRHIAEVVVDATCSACIPALIEAGERDPQLREFRHRYSARRRQALVDLINRGIAAGETSAGIDPELAAQALLGPVFYARFLTSRRFSPDRAGELVTAVLGGWAPAGGSADAGNG